MQQSNKKPSAALGRNNYSPVSSTDAPLEEDSKEEPSDNSNANNNNNVNHSFVPTISTTKEEDNRVTPHAPSTTPQTRHDPITTSLYQLQST
jgi:hypothetical protein